MSETPPSASFTLTTPDANHLFDSAARYALGRGTYAEDGVLAVLERNLMFMAAPARRRLLAWAMRTVNAMPRAAGPYPARWLALSRLDGALAAGHRPSGPLDAGAIDVRILLFSAFRYDIESDDASLPAFWERMEREHRRALHRDNWDWNSARDLVWAHLVPLDEPVPAPMDMAGRITPPDDRWRAFYRLMVTPYLDANERIPS